MKSFDTSADLSRIAWQYESYWREITSQPNANIMQSGNVFRAAIASDLHAYGPRVRESSIEPPSFYDIQAASNPVTQNPISALKDLIKKECLQADVLLCPGDLADRADPLAMGHAWQALHELSVLLNAELVSTPGNHDVDSRYTYNGFDAKGALQAMEPRFPFQEDAEFDRFWSRHFVVRVQGPVRIVVLNSSAFHGAAGPLPVADEYKHGRISPYTLDALRRELAAGGSFPLNIMMFHHHPMPLDEHGLGAHDIMTGGSDLLRLLERDESGEWFVVHGHKHFPKLAYAQATTSTAPTVFSAGSLCVRLHSEIADKARNQFYVVEFPLDEISEHGLVGTYRAWDWSMGIGWQPAQRHSGLPHKGGFGFRERPLVVARAIVGLFGASQNSMHWSDAVTACPRVNYYLPNDTQSLYAAIRNQGFRILFDHDVPVSIERAS